MLPRLYLPLIMLLCAAYTWMPLVGPDDFWSHAAIGRWIWTRGEIPHRALFIWGDKTLKGIPTVHWADDNWLSQVGYYFLMTIGGHRWGPYLALWMTVAFVCLTFAILYKMWVRHARATVFLPPIFALALWCSAPRFHPRPELTSALCLAILLTFLLERHNPSKPFFRTPLAGALIVGMFVLWTNLHGGVAMGIAIMVMALAGDLLQDRLKANRRRPSGIRQLALLTLLCGLAMLINPYGYHYFSALMMVDTKMFTQIDEWKPYWKYPVMSIHFVWGEAALISIAIAVWIRSPDRRWSQLIWLLFIGKAFLMQRRHLWTAAEIALATIGYNAACLDTDALWRGWRKLTQPRGDDYRVPLGMRVIAQSGALACLGSAIAIATPRNILPLQAQSANMPIRLVRYMEQHHPPTPLFNDYESSSYLEWRLAGHPSLYIDLVNAYPGQLLDNYFEIIGATKKGLGMLDRLKVRTVEIRAHRADEAMQTLQDYLNAGHGWKHVYTGADGDIWTRPAPR